MESTHGEGSTFSFTANFGLSKPDEVKSQSLVSDLSGLSVLVVDDSLASLKIMQNMAESLGLEVELAEDGVEALDKVRHADQAGTPYRIVFTDWKMPNMNGIDLCRQIKSDTSLNTPPKVVIVTAYDNDMSRIQLTSATDGLIPKNT